jgi:hypothetical protein
MISASLSSNATAVVTVCPPKVSGDVIVVNPSRAALAIASGTPTERKSRRVIAFLLAGMTGVTYIVHLSKRLVKIQSAMYVKTERVDRWLNVEWREVRCLTRPTSSVSG